MKYKILNHSSYWIMNAKNLASNKTFDNDAVVTIVGLVSTESSQLLRYLGMAARSKIIDSIPH